MIVDAGVKELELTIVAGEPIYLATLVGGDTRIVPLDGAVRTAFARQRFTEIVTSAVGSSNITDVQTLDQYDRYYLDRRRQRPLPVMLVRLNDQEKTRYYIDPKAGRIVGSYSTRNWVTRWVYHGLHSLDFPWLYNHRPAWDIVVIAFMIGGTALCVTSLILAWRVVGRKLDALVTADGRRRAPALSEDLDPDIFFRNS